MILENIVKFIKKNFVLKDILLILLEIGLYLTTRLVNLTKFPIFSDEGIYIH
jgi:hypothetical protein